MIATVFVALVAGHYAGDFLVQTDHQSAHKAERSWRGVRAMYGHLIGYLACQSAALVLLQLSGIKMPAPAAYAALAFSVITHGFIDRRWPVVWWGEHTGSAAFVAADNPVHGRMHVDQAMHFVCMFLAAVVFAWVAG